MAFLRSREGFAIHAIEATLALFIVLTFIIFVTPGIIFTDATDEITRATVAAAIKTADDNGTLRADVLSMNFTALDATFKEIVPRRLQFTVGACTTNSTILSWGTAGNASHYVRAPPGSDIISMSADLNGTQFLGSFPSDLALDAGNDTSIEFNMTGSLVGPFGIGSAFLVAAADAGNAWLARNPACDSYLDFPESSDADGICEVPLRWVSSSAGEAALTLRACVAAAKAPENVSLITIGHIIAGANATFSPTEFFITTWQG